MNLSPEKIASPVAFVLVGLIMMVLGAIGVVPIGDPYPVIEPAMRVVLIALGIFILLLGPALAWVEITIAKQVGAQLSPKNIRPLATEIVKVLRREFFDQISPPPRAQSLFEERKSHFREEKQHLADHFITPLLQRCQALAAGGKQVYLLIDSGTTLYPFFERLGEATVRAYNNGEKWIEKLFVETNNIPGVEMLMQAGRVNPNNRYSPLAINCDLLPGVPLPIYSALTGRKTVAALQQLREETKDDVVFIALTTGNWIRLRRTPPVCPVPLARGIGHLEFKQALIDYSDEIFVVTPLGKVFVDVPPGDVNVALGFDEKRPDPDKQPYHEVQISNEKAVHMKMISTARSPGCVLSDHSTRVRALLGVDTLDLGIILKRFPETSVAELQHLIFPFDRLPRDWFLQIETEFPHSHTRNEVFMHNFFFVPSVPRQSSKGKRD